MLAALWADGGDYDGPFRDMVHIDREVSVLEASRVMRCRGVDVLLVTDPGHGALVPVGVVTARDIVSRVLAAGLDAAVVTMGDIAWSDEGNTLGSAPSRTIASQT
jgi:CBS domain-containing protein